MLNFDATKCVLIHASLVPDFKLYIRVVAHERVLAWYGIKNKKVSDEDEDYDQYFDEMDMEEAFEAFYA